MQITLIPPKIEETKKEENKQYNFNFDELDDMGEVLDFDLDGNTDENTLISNYFGSQDKNKHKSDFERNDSTLVKNSTEINNQKQSIVSDQIGSSQLEQFFNKNYNFDEGRCANPEYDPLNIALKKTKSQNLNFSELGFSNSRSLQTLNHHQKDQILLQLLKERGSFQEKLRLAESEIMDKEYHIECMMKGGNVLPLDMTQARLHLAFLFSSPLIRRTNSSIENIMQLDYLTEIDDILKVCSRRKYEMKYKIDVATVSNLRSTITDCPVALHFSGHGIENTPENLGSEYAIFKGRGNILLLEDEHGMADYFFEEDLKHMIEMSKNTFEVVFVSSCYSQFAGEVFLNAGAKHVICIKSGERISDKASLRFSRVFYETLFVKNYNVCASFNIAKEEISKVINSSEASKFILLIQDKDTQFFRAKNSHKCYALSNYQPGVLTNIDNKPIFDSNPSNVDCFVGRQQDMYEIINLLDYHRLVSILGPPGIGKTSISRNIANYLKDRKKFRDGIIYVTLRGCESAQMFMTRLSLIIRSACSLEEYKKYGLEEIDKRNSAKDECQKNEIDESKYRNFILNMLKEREVLLILDNAEDPLEDDNAKFINGLELILDNCSKVKFLVTTRKTINKLAHNQEKPYILQPLSKEASLKLLITKSPRDIKNMELQELLTCSIPKNCKIGQNLNVKLVNQHEKCTLLDHPFTALLGGHPQAISLAAPLLEYKSLKRLFYAFCDSNLMDALDYPTSTQDPNKSLRLSLELSINHMKNTMPEALNLFGFIGLFPGGVSDDQITQMWENTQWMSLKDALVRASLLVYKTDSKGTFIYSMLPFMSIRAYELLECNEELRHTYHMKCCKLFNDECYDIYISDKSIDKIEKLVGMETNIWACIYRSLNRKKIIEYENDDLKSNLSDYFTSDNEKSAERLSVPKFNPKKYKEKEEKNTMEQLVEEENESSSSSDESDNINITNLVKVTEVNRSNERTYQSHFQLSPKESNKEVNQSCIDKEQDRDQQITSQRRQRRRKVGHVEKQKRSRYFNEEMLVIYYSTSLIMLNKYTDAMKAITEYLQKHGISELSLANLYKAKATLLMMSRTPQDIQNAVKYFKKAGGYFYDVGCKKGLAQCKFGLAKIHNECWSDILVTMKDKNEDMLLEAALNFTQNALRLFKQIGFARGEIFSEKLEDYLKKKTHNEDRIFKTTRHFIDLAKRAQKEIGLTNTNSWIGEETAFLLEITLDDVSHLPPTEQHMVKKINGEFINMTNKIDKKKNFHYKKNEKVYESENINDEFSNKIIIKPKESKLSEISKNLVKESAAQQPAERMSNMAKPKQNNRANIMKNPNEFKLETKTSSSIKFQIPRPITPLIHSQQMNKKDEEKREMWKI